MSREPAACMELDPGLLLLGGYLTRVGLMWHKLGSPGSLLQ